jgi:hypothetical protein
VGGCLHSGWLALQSVATRRAWNMESPPPYLTLVTDSRGWHKNFQTDEISTPLEGRARRRQRTTWRRKGGATGGPWRIHGGSMETVRRSSSTSDRSLFSTIFDFRWRGNVPRGNVPRGNVQRPTVNVPLSTTLNDWPLSHKRGQKWDWFWIVYPRSGPTETTLHPTGAI